MARRSKYDPETFPDIARAKARKGHTESEIAKMLGVSDSSFAEYKNKYPEFLEALKEGKAPADAKVEAALYKRALGYEVQERKIVQMPDGSKRIELTTKEVLPDTTAQIFWVKNRMPDEWRDKQHQEITGKGGGPVRIRSAIEMTDEELERVIAGLK